MYKKKKVLIIVFLIFGVLVAPHEGEFWPFSIFPMFSQAGNPWTRSHVRVVDTPPESQSWQIVTEDGLDGRVLAMRSIDVNQNDVSNFVSKTTDWNERALNNMRNLLGEVTTRENIVIYKVNGRLHSESRDSVLIEYTPLIMFTPDTTLTHPDIPRLQP